MTIAPRSSSNRTLIVADDLTGACDAAVAFAAKGLRTRVLLDGAFRFSECQKVCAISTESRDLTPDDSGRRLAAVASNAEIAGFTNVFKKIDSVFRGNTVHEIVAAIRLFRRSLSVIAPSYPALGRTSEDGVVRVGDIHGEHQIPALELLRSTGLNPLRISTDTSAEVIAARMVDSGQNHGRILYVDASEQAHLDAAVRAANCFGQDILWIGSGGLAHALAGTYAVANVGQSKASTGKVLIFAGSDHPVTHRQLEHLLTADDIACGTTPSAAIVQSAEANAVLFRITCGRTSEQTIAAAVESVEPSNVSCLFLTGGDTAALVCRALGITAVDLQVEFAPGLAQGAAVGGRFAGRTLVLKSGGFGDAATISAVVDQFARGKRKEVSLG